MRLLGPLPVSGRSVIVPHQIRAAPVQTLHRPDPFHRPRKSEGRHADIADAADQKRCDIALRAAENARLLTTSVLRNCSDRYMYAALGKHSTSLRGSRTSLASDASTRPRQRRLPRERAANHPARTRRDSLRHRGRGSRGRFHARLVLECVPQATHRLVLADNGSQPAVGFVRVTIASRVLKSTTRSATSTLSRNA